LKDIDRAPNRRLWIAMWAVTSAGILACEADESGAVPRALQDAAGGAQLCRLSERTALYTERIESETGEPVAVAEFYTRDRTTSVYMVPLWELGENQYRADAEGKLSLEPALAGRLRGFFRFVTPRHRNTGMLFFSPRPTQEDEDLTAPPNLLPLTVYMAHMVESLWGHTSLVPRPELDVSVEAILDDVESLLTAAYLETVHIPPNARCDGSLTYWVQRWFHKHVESFARLFRLNPEELRIALQSSEVGYKQLFSQRFKGAQARLVSDELLVSGAENNPVGYLTMNFVCRPHEREARLVWRLDRKHQAIDFGDLQTLQGYPHNFR